MEQQVHPETVTILVSRLVDQLRGRGLWAEPVGANMVRATNRAADPPDGRRSGPGLRQTVLCRADSEGRQGWWWLWSERDGEPEHEWICPAMEITMAADAIARVLALQPAEQTGR